MPVSPQWAITVALSHESKALLAKMKVFSKTQYGNCRIYEGELQGQACLLVQTGMGPTQAEKAARFLFQNYSVTHLISTGYCGALAPKIPNGAAILATELLSNREPQVRISSNPDWLKQVETKLQAMDLPCLRGVMIESDRPVLEKENKLALGQSSGAIAVDMESFSILKVAQEKTKIASLALRFVVDPLETNLTSTESFVDETARVKPLSLLREGFRRPKIFIELPGLQRLAHRARHNLEKSMLALSPLDGDGRIAGD